jgi:hypothetical protein
MVSKQVPPEQLGSVRFMVKFAFVAASPLVSITWPVTVYCAPGKSRLVIEMLGPPWPPLPGVVSRL